MNCLTPELIKSPDWRKEEQNTDMYQWIPCRKCVNCRKITGRDWVFRLEQEEKLWQTAAFITVTYREEEVPVGDGHLSLHKKDHTNFMKRLRTSLHRLGYRTMDDNNKPKALKLVYFMCGEYGTKTRRPHFHYIMFNLPDVFIYDWQYLQSIWGHGNIRIDPCTRGTMSYVAGYVNKPVHHDLHLNEFREPEFRLASKGIGANYLTPERIKHLKKVLRPYLTVENGRKIRMPRYYKDKVFNDEEKANLALKSKEYVEENPTFKSEKEKIDYINHVNYLEHKKLHEKRNSI